ncbi:MAG: Ig-like domain-containing protein [Lachnospiraceae bacterium]|nr:Ig-like domain-containing protein [Lachnospiraceae bacterium]
MKLMKKMIAYISVIALLISVIGFLPVQAQATTAKPKINVSSKVIYVGGSSVRPAYGETYTFYIKNRPKKYSVTWSSSDEKVAKIEKLEYSKAKVTAVSAGKATITADFIDKVSSTKYTLTTVVTVKKNAAAISISPTVIPKLDKGETISLSATLYNKDASEAKAGEITDFIRWTSSNTSAATVTNAGVVTAVGAGKATLTCYTVQKSSGTYSQIEKATAKKSIEIIVNDPSVVGITKVTQLTTTDIAIDFGGNYSDNITRDNLEITRDKTPIMIKDIKFENNGTRAVVTLYQDFTDGAQYLVRYNNSFLTEGQETVFVASVGEPSRIELYTEAGLNRVIAGKLTPIKFKIYNAANVDITPKDVNSQDYLSAMSRLTLKSTDQVGGYTSWYIDNSSKGIYILEAGKSVSLVGEYTYFSLSGSSYQEKKVTGVIVVNSVSEASTMTYEAATITKSEKNGSLLDWEKPVTMLSVSDTTGYKLVAKIKKSDGSYLYSNDADSHIIFGAKNQVKIKSCYVNTNGTLIPFETGSEDVVIYYGDDVTTGIPIGQMSINVVDKRIPSRMIIEQNNVPVTALKMSDAYNVSKEYVTLKLLDQFGQQIDITGEGSVGYVSNITVSSVESDGPSAYCRANTDGTGLIELDALGRGASTGKNYRIKVSYSDTAYGSLDGYFSVLVFSPNSSLPSTYSVSVEGDTNMKITAMALPELKINLYEVKNGVKYQKVDHVKVSTNVSGYSIYDGDFFYKLYKANTSAEIKKGVVNDSIKIVYNEDGNGLVKYETGAYVIKVFKRQSINGQIVDPQVAAVEFTLTDTTGALKWELISPTTTTAIKEGMDAEMLKPILGECMKFYIGNESVGTSQITFPEQPIVNNGQVFFRTVAITQAITVGGASYSLKHTLTINTVIRSK